MNEEVYRDAARPHEPKDASIPVIVVSLAAILAMIVASLIVGFALWSGKGRARRDLPQQSFRHGPADVPSVVQEWPAIDRETHEHLETYGWVDRKAGIVRIPIEQAMKRMEEGGP